MDQDNKIYMNQVWHKIKIAERKKELSQNNNKISILVKSITIILSLIILLLTLLIPESLEGVSIFIGLIIISITTYVEYKNIIGGTYEL